VAKDTDGEKTAEEVEKDRWEMMKGESEGEILGIRD
jgi:hypothetical protein